MNRERERGILPMDGWDLRDESRHMLGVVKESSRAKNGSNKNENTQTNHQGNPCYH